MYHYISKKSIIEYYQKAKFFVLAVVQQNDKALQYADAALKADRDVVLAAVQQDGRALEYADAALRADREIVLAAVQNNERALLFAAYESPRDHAGGDF